MGDVIQFRRPTDVEIIPIEKDEQCWYCSCGCNQYYFCLDLTIECVKCGEFDTVENFITRTKKENDNDH